MEIEIKEDNLFPLIGVFLNFCIKSCIMATF